jgi:23S rRNA (uracil1939-C5)-methyltransferase
MAQTRDGAKVGGWFAEGYSCVSMDPAPKAKFRPGQALCPHAQTCPGCPLLDLSYPEQLAHKLELVRAELTAYRELTQLTLLPSQPAKTTFAYRTRAKLVAEGPALGLYARGTHQVLDIPGCRVLDPMVASVVAALRGLLPREPLLAGVDVAKAGAHLLVTLIASEEASDHWLRELASQLVARCPEVSGVASTRRARDAVQLLSAGHALLYGEGQARAALAAEGPYHYVAFGAFLQAHEEVAARIYEALSARVFANGAARPRVLELYAGAGALSLALAARGAEVVAVESYGPACERLARAAKEQDLPVRVRQGDAAAQLALLRDERAVFDAVLVNPPRRGLAPEVRKEVAALAPSAIGYVSCRPSTLARDLAHFAQLGFRSESAEPFDMMPMTSQVETVAFLGPAPVPALVVCAREADTIVLDKPAFVSTDALLARVRELAGFERAAPVVSLSPEASGLIAFAHADASDPPAARDDQPHTFIVLAKGVLRARGKLRGRAGSLVRYQRERVIRGHSLLRVFARDELAVRRALCAIAHPVLGDAKSDREGARHFAARHGLDRAFLHLCELAGVAEAALPITSPLAPDLSAVLRSLEGQSSSDALSDA